MKHLANFLSACGDIIKHFGEVISELDRACIVLGGCGIALSAILLERIITILSKRPTNTPIAAWKEEVQTSKIKVHDVVRHSDALTEQYLSESQDFAADDCQADLYNTLSELTQSAAITIVTNREIWDGFKRGRIEAIAKAAINGIGMLGSGAMIAGAIVTGTEFTAGLVVIRGLVGTVGVLMGQGAPVVATTAMTVCPPLLIAGSVLLAYNSGSMVKNIRDAKQLKKHVEMSQLTHAFITGAWQNAYHTLSLMRWIYMTGNSSAEEADFVDDEARQRWTVFITRIRASVGQPVTAEELRAPFVVATIAEQARGLRLIQDKFLEGGRKFCT